jgi:hypothetical protein
VRCIQATHFEKILKAAVLVIVRSFLIQKIRAVGHLAVA